MSDKGSSGAADRQLTRRDFRGAAYIGATVLIALIAYPYLPRLAKIACAVFGLVALCGLFFLVSRKVNRGKSA